MSRVRHERKGSLYKVVNQRRAKQNVCNRHGFFSCASFPPCPLLPCAVSHLVADQRFELFESQGRGKETDERIARPTGQRIRTGGQRTNLARASIMGA